jgi:cell division septal protein FtsQ
MRSKSLKTEFSKRAKNESRQKKKNEKMFKFVVLFALIACVSVASAHMFTVGGVGPKPNDQECMHWPQK